MSKFISKFGGRRVLLSTLIVLLIGLVGGMALFFTMRKPAGQPVRDGDSAVIRSKNPGKGDKRAIAAERRKKSVRRISRWSLEDYVKSLPESLQKDARQLEEARSSENKALILEKARILLASKIPEARREAVAALGETGWAGLGDIVSLIVDEDREVAEAARDALDAQLFESNDSSMKRQIMQTVAESVVDVDPEYLETILSDFWVQNEDAETLDFLVPLYSQTTAPDSQKIILDMIDNIVLADQPSKTLEDAVPKINEWWKEMQEENNSSSGGASSEARPSPVPPPQRTDNVR